MCSGMFGSEGLRLDCGCSEWHAGTGRLAAESNHAAITHTMPVAFSNSTGNASFLSALALRCIQIAEHLLSTEH